MDEVSEQRSAAASRRTNAVGEAGSADEYGLTYGEGRIPFGQNHEWPDIIIVFGSQTYEERIKTPKLQ